MQGVGIQSSEVPGWVGLLATVRTLPVPELAAVSPPGRQGFVLSVAVSLGLDRALLCKYALDEQNQKLDWINMLYLSA